MRRRLFETAAAAKVATSAAQRRGAVDADALQHAAPAVADRRVAGAAPDHVEQARALARASGGRRARMGRALLQLQRDYGNRYVQRVVQHAGQAPRPAPITRPSLALGPAEDRHEHAAERVAQQVVSGASPRQAAGDTATGRVLRMPAVQREHDLEGGVVDGRVRQAIQGGVVDGRVQQAIQGARGGGQPLPERVRDSVEPVVGVDLSQVRLHTDARADQLTRLLQARAFTTGPEIFLRRGEYRPDSTAGRRLLAHELTHVAQQTGGTVNAGGVSGLPPGPAGAGVIQRMVIEGHETEDESHLRKLKDRVWEMKDLGEVQAMRSEIERQLPGADPGKGALSLLQFLKIKEGSINRQTQQRRAQSAHEPVVSPPVPVSESVHVVSPVGGMPASGIHEGKPDLRGEQPLPEQRPLAGGLTLESVVPPESQGPVAGADMTTWGEALIKWAAKLKDGPGAAETRLESINGFLQQQKKWSEDFVKLTRRAQSRPLRDLKLMLENEASDLRLQKRGLELKLKSAEGKEQEPECPDVPIPRRQEEVAAGRKVVDRYVRKLIIKIDDEAQNPQESIPALLVHWIFTAAIGEAEVRASQWIASLLSYLQKLNEGNMGLLVMVNAETKRRVKVAGMGGEEHVFLNIDLSSWDPRKVLIGGDRVHKAARAEFVTETASSFLHEASHSLQAIRYKNESYPWTESEGPGKFLTPGLTGFLPKDLPADVRSALKEFEQGGSSNQMQQSALGEFEQGGSSKQAEKDVTWGRILKELHTSRYYGPGAGKVSKDIGAKELVPHLKKLEGAWRDEDRFRRVFPKCAALLDWDRILKNLGAPEYYDPETRLPKDIRAKELVSHLMELAYAWRDEGGFRDVFPMGAALLDRVIKEQAPAPGI